MQSSPKKMDAEVRGQKNRNVTLHTNDTQHVKASSSGNCMTIIIETFVSVPNCVLYLTCCVSDCSSLPHSTPKLNNKDLTTGKIIIIMKRHYNSDFILLMFIDLLHLLFNFFL